MGKMSLRFAEHHHVIRSHDLKTHTAILTTSVDRYEPGVVLIRDDPRTQPRSEKNFQ